MSGFPCVQFLVDASTGRALANSTRYKLVPRIDPAEQFLAVSCDSRGWVVVRKLHEKTNAMAIATACWQADRLAQHAHQAPVQWMEIEAALRDALAGASTVADADRTSIDETALGVATGTHYEAPEKKTISKQVGAAIGFVVMAGLVVGGIVIYERVRGKFDRGNVGNGDKCTRDTECASGRCGNRVCASGRCGNRVCRSAARGSAGNWCEADKDCDRGVCYLRKCHVKGTLSVGDTCDISAECASGACRLGDGGRSICR